jgi:hypothetical protein
MNAYEGLIEDNRFISADAYEANNQWAMSKIAVLKKDAATQTEPSGARRSAGGLTLQRQMQFPPASALRERSISYESPLTQAPLSQDPHLYRPMSAGSVIPAAAVPPSPMRTYSPVTYSSPMSNYLEPAYRSATPPPTLPSQARHSPPSPLHQYRSPSAPPPTTAVHYGYMSSPGGDDEQMDVDNGYSGAFDSPPSQPMSLPRQAHGFLFSDREPSGHYDTSSPQLGGFGFDDAPPTTSLHSLTL